MVCDSYTQYNEAGIGVSISNNGYAQLVSIFTIGCEIGIGVSSGGQCDLTNSNSSFGIKGLVIDPFNQISQDREGNKREDEHIRDIIAKCQQFARNYQVWVCMVAHPHKLHRNDAGVIPPPDLYQVSGSAHWANMADAGLVIHRDFENNVTRIITRKIREQGVYGEIGQVEFTFNFRTRCYE